MEPGYLHDDIVYIMALRFLSGIGPQTQRQLVLSFPTFHNLLQASEDELAKVFRPSSASSMYQSLHQSIQEWERAGALAKEMLDRHRQADIVPVPISASIYPLLLKKIPDPPVILYVKGHLSLLQQTNMVAIVGTRKPTAGGEQVAYHLARHFAQFDYCVVSGLAKGIDAAAHRGALEARGKTIAVFGTPLDQVYPAIHRELAEQILANNGLLVSELPLGRPAFRSTFVLRDRIQSGLSLAVIPVQTTKDGGTMHTVNFAKIQQRLIACPVPLRSESNANQYEGIYALFRDPTLRVYPFKAGSIEQSDILSRLQQVKQELLLTQKQEEHSQESQRKVLPERHPSQASDGDRREESPQTLLPGTQADGSQEDEMGSPPVTKIPPPGKKTPQNALLVVEVSSPQKRTRLKKPKSLHQPLLSDGPPLEASDVSSSPTKKVAESEAPYTPDCVQVSLW